MEGLQWVGKWTLEGRKVSRRIGETVLEEKVVENERQRLEVIRDVFRIGVSPADEKWIVGRGAELKET